MFEGYRLTTHVGVIVTVGPKALTNSKWSPIVRARANDTITAELATSADSELCFHSLTRQYAIEADIHRRSLWCDFVGM